MFLTDTVHAIYCDAAPTLSTNEVCIKMPSSNYPFRAVYTALLNGHSRLPDDLKSREDCLLLLTALLSDIVYLNRSNQGTQLPPVLANHASDGHYDHGKPLRNPYAPLSAQSE